MTPIDWLMSDDTGTSSKTICAVITGSSMNYPDVPHDPSDFGRCHRLLSLFPEWRPRLHEVAEKYPMWGPMVAAWDELTALYREESEDGAKAAPKLYARMRELIDEGRIAAGWKQTGPGSWSGPGVDVVEFGEGLSLRFDR